MAALITILIVVACILLGIVILVQNPKGGGLATGFTGANQFGGVKRTTDFLEKSTWTLIIVLFSLSVVSASISQKNIVQDGQSDTNMEQMIEDEQPTGQGLPAPAQQEPQPLEDEAPAK